MRGGVSYFVVVSLVVAIIYTGSVLFSCCRAQGKAALYITMNEFFNLLNVETRRRRWNLRGRALKCLVV